MKKLVSIMMAATMLCATPVYAANVDLDSMTIEELVELRNQVAAEISSRISGDDMTIYPGTYIVGKDIKAGSWLFTDTGEEKLGGSIYVISDEESFKNQDESAIVFKNDYIKATETAALNLEDGMVLYLDATGQLEELQPAYAP